MKKKKTICHLMDFAVPVDHRVKVKENKTIDKYLDLSRKLKKLRNIINVTVISIVDCALGMVSKGLEKRLEEFEIKGRI